jgi:GNAT superfamily N-acetyltransferase
MSKDSHFSPALVCRPALPMDTPQVLDLAKHIWEGHDYISYVWDDWLSDPSGLLAVAEYGRRIVGLGKLTYLSPGQWWLEGLRVHPEFAGRGIASHINDYLLADWLRVGSGCVRLTTSSKRVKVHSLCAHRGFVKTGEYAVYVAPSLAEPVESFTPVLPEEILEALESVRHSPVLPLLRGLMDHGWRWGVPSQEGLAPAVRDRYAWWWHGKRGLLAFWRDEDENVRFLALHLIACPVERISACLLDFRRLAARLGYDQVEWIVPLHAELMPVLAQAGFKQFDEEVLFMFVKQHPSLGKGATQRSCVRGMG